jgi:putative tricarboxylic transport membrane protein
MNARYLLATASLLLAATASAQAEFKPTHPIEVVVHGGPGSGNDVLARELISIIDQDKLSPVRLQVANKVGGGSTAAAAYVMSKAADRYVVAIYTIVWVTDPLTQEEAKNRLQDMTPITRMMEEPALVAVRADSPFKTMDDFIKAAKEKPGAMKQSGGSITSRDNILRQLLMKTTGANWTFIPFPSGGERVAALLGGHAELMIMDPSEATEQVRGGKLRLLAQVGEKRLSTFPDVPTLKEAGYKLPDVPQTRGVVGTPGMPADAVAFYEDLFYKVSQSPLWKKYLDNSQLQGVYTKSGETKQFLDGYEKQVRDILKEAGAKVVR